MRQSKIVLLRKSKEKRDLIVHYGIESYKDTQPTYVTMGMFDGVHIGHQALIRSVVEEAKEAGKKSVVVSFWPHPKKVLNKDADIELLSTIEEKIAEIEKLGVDHLLLLTFDIELSSLTADQFVDIYFVSLLHAEKVTLGYNHRFGSDKLSHEECVSIIRTKGIATQEFSKMSTGEGLKVSSSEARRYLEIGDVEKLRLLLGREYSIEGKVVHGMQLGRKLGYPTANISELGEGKMVPKNGVYVALVDLVEKRNIKTHYGVVNIGIKPTIGKFERNIEVFLLEYCGNLYEHNINVRFLARLRDEIRFNNLEELKHQIAKDIDEAMIIVTNRFMRHLKNDV